MTVEEAKLIWQRWIKKRYYGDEYNRTLMLSGYEFRTYPLNIFTLNSKALKIQHAFFGVKAGVRKVVSGRRRVARDVSKSFVNSSTKLSHVKSGGKLYTVASSNQRPIRSSDYVSQPDHQQTREERIVEARKKYGSQSRLSASSKAKSRPATAEKHKAKKIAPTLMKQPTISDAELQMVMQNAWAKAETDKQKKLKQIKTKRPPLRTQDSINEEILVNKIVSKAWIEVDDIKQKRHDKVVHPKPALHSQESILEAKQVSAIVGNAWKKVEKEKKNSASKIPKIKKKPLRSQESINEEKLVGEIMVTAWDKAEKLKKQTEK